MSWCSIVDLEPVNTGLTVSCGCTVIVDVVIYYYLQKMVEHEEAKKTKKKHVDLTLVDNYLRYQKFPDDISTKGDIQLMYKGNRLVVTYKQRRIDIIHDVHQELGNNVNVVAMSSLLGRTSTYQKISSRFDWNTIVIDVADDIKGCDNCQKHLYKKVKEEWINIAVPSEVMKQIGVDICCLSNVDEFEYDIVCIYYFSKWLKLNQSMINLHQQLFSFFLRLFAGMAVLLSKQMTRAENL